MSEAKIVVSAVDQTRAAFESAKQNLTALHTKAMAVTGAISALGITAYVATLTADIGRAIQEWDELGKASQRAGFQSAQGMAEFQFAAKLAGIDAGGFEGAISKLNGKMADAAGGSKEAAALFQAMGVRVKDASGNLRATEDVLTDLAEKFASYKDGPEKAALAAELFGEKAGRRLIPLLNGGADGLERLREEFRKLRGEMSPDLVKQAEAFNDNITRLEANIGGLSRSMAEKMLPSLVKITDAMVEQAKKGSFLGTVWAGLVETAKSFAGVDVVKGKRAQLEMLEESLRVGGDSPDGKLAARIQKLREEVGVASPSASTGDFARLDRKAPLATAPVTSRKPGDSPPENEGASILKRIRERIAGQTAELEAGRKLTDQEAFAVKVNADLANTKHAVDAATRAQIASTLKLSDANARALEARTRQIAMDKEIFEEAQRAGEERAAAEVRDSQARTEFRLAVDEQTRSLEENAKQLELEARLLGSTDRERRIALEQLRIELQLRRDMEALDRNLAFDEPGRDEERLRLRRNAATAKDQVVERVDIDARTEFTEGFRTDMRGALMRAFEDSKNPGRAFIEGFANTLYARTSARLADALANALAGKTGGGGGGFLEQLFRGFPASGSSVNMGSASGADMSLFYASAKGNVFDSPGLSAYSNRVVNKPTLFAFARGAGLMGEAGPEAIMPLRRGRDGRLGVEAAPARGRDLKLTIINPNGPPIQRVTQRTVSDDERVLIIDQAVQAVAAQFQSANSEVSRSLRSTHNVVRKR